MPKLPLVTHSQHERTVDTIFVTWHASADLAENLSFGWCYKKLVPVSAESADGLCYQLAKACPKEPEVIPFKELEIERHEIQTLKKLGAGQFGEVWAGTLPHLLVLFKKCSTNVIYIVILIPRYTVSWAGQAAQHICTVKRNDSASDVLIAEF